MSSVRSWRRLFLALLACCLTVGVVTIPSGAAFAATKRSISLVASGSVVTQNGAAVLSGTVSKTPAGKPVLIERPAGGRKWAKVAQVRTTAGGAYSFAAPTGSLGSSTYRARAPKKGKLKEATSAPVTVTVVPVPAAPVPTAATALVVQVVNAPTGTSPDVTLTDPSGAKRVVHQGTTIDPAAAGTWSVSAAPFTVGSDKHYAVVPTQTVTVASQQTTTVTVDYQVTVPDTTDVVPASKVTAMTAGDGTAQLTVPSTSAIDTGDVVAVGVGPQTPYGVLGKVTSVSGQTVSLDTDDVTLIDAISNGTADISVPLGAGDVVDPGEDAPDSIAVQNAVQSQPRADADDAVKKDVDKKFKCQGTMTAKLTGSASLTQTVSFSADWDLLHGVTRARIEAAVDETATALATLDIGGEKGKASCTLERTALLKSPIYFKPITFSVGPVPVVLVPTLQFYVDGDGHLQAHAEAGVTQKLHASAGIEYRDGGFHPVQSFSNTFTRIGPSFTGQADAQAGIAAELKVDLYGVGGPRVYVRGSVEADAQAKGDLSAGKLAWNLDARIKAAAAFDVDVLDLHSDELELFNKKFDLANGELSYNPPAGPQIATTSLPDATVATAYDQQLATVDGRSGTWSISSGSLPAGLSLRSGHIKGTPTATGTSTFAVGFDDGYATTEQQLGLVVQQAPLPPEPTPTSVGSRPTLGTLPGDAAASGQQAQYNGISCKTVAFCATVGTYTTTSGARSTFVAGLDPVNDRTAVAPIDPELPTSGDTFQDIDCPAVNWCATFGLTDDHAVLGIFDGSHVSAAPGQEILAATNTVVRWLSCGGRDACAAVGYRVGAGAQHIASIATLDGSGVHQVDVPLPSDAMPGGESLVERVTCPTASTCYALGHYAISSTQKGILAARLQNGMWSMIPVSSSIPTLTNDPLLNISRIECPTATACYAASSYGRPDNLRRIAFASLDTDHWTLESLEPLHPDQLRGDVHQDMGDLACPTVGHCTLVTTETERINPAYARSAGVLQVLSDDTWTAYKTIDLPGAGSDASTGLLNQVTCTSTGVCVVTGFSSTSTWVFIADPATSSATRLSHPTGGFDGRLLDIECPGAKTCIGVGRFAGGGGSLAEMNVLPLS